MYDSDPIATYSYLIKELDKKGIAFIEMRNVSELEMAFDQKKVKAKDQIPDAVK